MATLKLELKGLNEAISNIQGFAKKKQAEIIQELDRTTIMVETHAKNNLTSNKSVISGLLRAGTKRDRDPGKFQRVVSSNPFYAPFVEFGTRPHVIYPRTKKALKTPYGVFKKVNHPGGRPKPFLFPAAEAERANFVRNLTVILSRP